MSRQKWMWMGNQIMYVVIHPTIIHFWSHFLAVLQHGSSSSPSLSELLFFLRRHGSSSPPSLSVPEFMMARVSMTRNNRRRPTFLLPRYIKRQRFCPSLPFEIHVSVRVEDEEKSMDKRKLPNPPMLPQLTPIHEFGVNVVSFLKLLWCALKELLRGR